MFIPQRKHSEDGKTGEAKPENARIQMRPRRPVRPVGMGQKNNDRVSIRNRRYKIKRFLAQPRNTDVKQNGRVVRRMVVRRQTIYPSTRRRREY